MERSLAGASDPSRVSPSGTAGSGQQRVAKYQLLSAASVESSPLAEFIHSPESPSHAPKPAAAAGSPIMLDDFFLDVDDAPHATPDMEAEPPAWPHVDSYTSGKTNATPTPQPESRKRMPDQTVAASVEPCAVGTSALAHATAAVTAVQAHGDNAPPLPVFEGEGFVEVGTARKTTDEFDDEFDYAFEGGAREGETHKKVFKPKAIPAHLVSHVKHQSLGAVEEDEDAGEEEEEEEEEQEQEASGSSQAHQRLEQEWAATAIPATERQCLDKPGLSHAGARCDPFPPLIQNPAFVEDDDDERGYDDERQAVAHPAMAYGRAASQGNGAASTSAVIMDQTPGTSSVNSPLTAARPPQPAHNLRPERAEGGKPNSGAGGERTATAISPFAAQASVVPAADTASKAPPSAAQAASAAAAADSAPAALKPKEEPVQSPFSALAALPVQRSAGAGASADEWDLANLKVDEGHGPDEPQQQPAAAYQLCSYMQAFDYFRAKDLDPEALQAVAGVMPPPPGFFARLLCMGVPKLSSPGLDSERTRLLCLARIPFSEEEAMHSSLLRSLFASWTGREVGALPRFGSHWADLGFQGQDPATDLRSCGILGLLHLYLLHHHSTPNATKMYRLSHCKRQEFPLAVVSLNITKWTLQALREGRLTQEANRCSSVFDASGRFYIGTFYSFYNVWMKGSKTMSDSGYVMKDMEDLCRRRPQAMMDLSKEALWGGRSQGGGKFHTEDLLKGPGRGSVDQSH